MLQSGKSIREAHEPPPQPLDGGGIVMSGVPRVGLEHDQLELGGHGVAHTSIVRRRDDGGKPCTGQSGTELGIPIPNRGPMSLDDH